MEPCASRFWTLKGVVQFILLCINPSIITTDASLCQKHQIIVASKWSVSIMQLVTIFMNECHSLRGRDALIVITGAVTGHWGDYAALWWYSDLFVTLLYLIHSWCNIRGCFHSFSDSSYRYIINDLWMCLGNLNDLKVKRWEYFWKYFILTSITTYYHGWMIFKSQAFLK